MATKNSLQYRKSRTKSLPNKIQHQRENACPQMVQNHIHKQLLFPNPNDEASIEKKQKEDGLLDQLQ